VCLATESAHLFETGFDKLSHLKITEHFDKLSMTTVEVWLTTESTDISETGFEKLSHLTDSVPLPKLITKGLFNPGR